MTIALRFSSDSTSYLYGGEEMRKGKKRQFETKEVTNENQIKVSQTPRALFGETFFVFSKLQMVMLCLLPRDAF